MIGPHIILPTRKALEWARKAPIVKSLNNILPFRIAPAESIRVFRVYFANQDVSAKPESVAEQILAYLRNYRHPKLYAEIYNETAQSVGYGLEEYVPFVKAVTEILHREGVKVAGFSFSTGQPNLASWKYLADHGFAGVDAVAIHAYWGNRGFTTENALYYRKVHQYLKGNHPPFIITECGRDAVEGGRRGWKRDGISPDQYIAELAAYAKELSKDSYVLGATVFTAGPTPDWEDFSTDDLDIEKLVQSVKEAHTSQIYIPSSPPSSSPPQHRETQPTGGSVMSDEIIARLTRLEQTVNQIADRLAQLEKKNAEQYAQLLSQNTYLTEAWKRFRQGKFQDIDGIVIAIQGGKPLDFTPTYPPESASSPPPAPTIGPPPRIIVRSSPNHGGKRSQTLGCVLHSTRGGASSVEREFEGTLNWFANPASQVSAHVVIAWDGTLAQVVDPDLIAWHARELNSTHLGAELVQPRPGDPISDAQYRTLAWWLREMAAKYGFPLSAETLPEHRETAPGKRDGKTDIGPPFEKEKLLRLLRAG